MKDLTIIGRAEKVDLLDFVQTEVPAKVDTGADLSSIWASSIRVQDDGLHFVLFAPESKLYSGEEIVVPKDKVEITRVASSFSQREIRYLVRLKLKIRGRIIQASFTLADRSNKLYPILIGRRLLYKKFLVDVAQGDPLVKEERRRKKRLQNELLNLKKEYV